MKLKRRRRKQFLVPLNSTSDMAFLLLIFIMLLALMNYRKVVKIEYPEAKTAAGTSAGKNLEIWIDQSGTVYLNGDESNLLGVERAVTDLYRGTPDTRVHIIADQNTPYQHVHKVLEILQILQYRVVSFVVKNSE